MNNVALGNIVSFGNGETIPKTHGSIPAYGGNGISGLVDTHNTEGETIIIGRVGAYCGSVHYYDGKAWVTDNALYVKPKNGVDTKFLSMYLRLINLNQFHVGSSQPLITQGILKKLEMHIPDINVQKTISYTLSLLYDKIELNNKINAELESTARALYNHWFVQFDFPNESGRPYKTAGGTMVYSEELKSEIPYSWTVKKLGEIEKNIITGKTPSTSDADNFDGDIPFVTIDDIRSALFVTKTSRTLSRKGANLLGKKCIPAGSIFVSCIGTAGMIGFASKDSYTNQQINSVVCQKVHNRYYLYFVLSDYFQYSVGAKSGNTIPNMSKGDFEQIKILIPNPYYVNEFTGVTEPLFARIHENIKENDRLIELRDWLLPMLINGQIKIRD